MPPGGWRRALLYMRHRLTRIPDAPHRIARGVACGIFVSFTPLIGLHLLLAAALAWLVRGNVVAALIGTVVGNPLTFPFIAVLSLDLGRAIMDTGDGVPFSQIMTAFGQAGDEIVRNLRAIFTSEVMAWDKLHRFVKGVFLPYLVGGIGPGLAFALAARGEAGVGAAGDGDVARPPQPAALQPEGAEGERQLWDGEQLPPQVWERLATAVARSRQRITQ